MIYVLTSHPTSAACVDLAARARALGIPMRVVGDSRRVGALAGVPHPTPGAQDLVFAYGASRRLLRELEETKAQVINGTVYSKHMQYERLRAAGIPVPTWRRLQGRRTSEQVSGLVGPVIVKPDFGGFGIGVRLLESLDELATLRLRRAHIVQEFIPCGGRCTRVVVLGSEVVTAIDRVARDGVVAAYRNGKSGWLESVVLDRSEQSLCVAAAKALGVEIAGVDLIRSQRGPFILEVNHRFVPFHLRVMYGEVMDQIALYLARRHATAAPAKSSSSSTLRLPRVHGWGRCTSAPTHASQASNHCAGTGGENPTFLAPIAPESLPRVHS